MGRGLDFRPSVRIAGVEVDGITLAGATIRYGADHPYAQPEPATAFLELVTSDVLESASTEYPGFSFGAGIPSGFVDVYVDTYEGTIPQLNIGAPVSVVVETPTGFTDVYVDDYLAGFSTTRFTGHIAALDYTPGLIGVTAISPIESLTRVTVDQAGWPIEGEVERVERIAQAAGVTVSVVGASSSTLVGTGTDADVVTVYEALADVADQCDGLIYADRDGRIVYRTRTATQARAVEDVVELGPGATLVDSLKMTTEAGTIVNAVTVKTGSAVTTAEDADSIARFGRREGSWDTGLDTPSREAFAARRIARYKDPRWHMPSAELVLNLAKTAGGSYPSNVAAILALDLDDQVALPQLLPASPVPSYTSRMLGYDETLDPDDWRFVFALDPYGWALLDAADPPYVPPPLGPSKDPQLEHTAAGRFRIRNYSADLNYTATLVTGSGTATLDKTTGVYTLSDANARFSVVTDVAGSVAGFAERKAYTYSSEDHGRWETTTTETVVNYDARWDVTDVLGDPATGPNQDQCPVGWYPVWVASEGRNRCMTQTGRWVCDNGGNLVDGGGAVYCRRVDVTTTTTWIPNVVTVKNPTPAGYQDNYGEWARTT